MVFLEWLHQKLASVVTNNPYCRTQAIFFEEEFDEQDESKKGNLKFSSPASLFIPPESKTLLGMHPHGILSIGWSLNCNSNLRMLPCKFSWLGADSIFILPFVSEFLTWHSACPASKKSFTNLMKQERNIAIIPGGFEEATLYERGVPRVYIRERKGFIKYSLMYGYKIRPGYTFGEENTYRAYTGLLGFRKWLNSFKIPGVIFLGKYGTLLPFTNVDLITVIGKEIILPHIPSPSQEDIDKYHEIYIKALVSLFNKFKHHCAADPTKELEIF